MIFALGFILLYTLPKVLLSALQLRFLINAKNGKAYILNKEEFQKSADYEILSQKCGILRDCIDGAIMAVWLVFGLNFLENFLKEIFSFIFGAELGANFDKSSGFLAFLNNEIVFSSAFLLSFLGIGAIFGLPFAIWAKFYLDEKFGFNKSTKAQFVKDCILGFIKTIIIVGLLSAALAWIFANITHWATIGFILCAVFILLAVFLFPLFSRLDNKFQNLEDESLKSDISALAKKAGVALKKFLVVDASKRDSRLNAYFAGFGKTKEVVLYDNLLAQVPREQILAVLAHELGHYAHKDTLKMLPLSLGLLALVFALIANLPASLFSAIGLQNAPHSLLVVLLILSNLIGFYLMPLINWRLCKAEYGADEYGAKMAGADNLAKGLLLITEKNKSFPFSHFLYEIFYHNHPSLVARLRALGQENLAISH